MTQVEAVPGEPLRVAMLANLFRPVVSGSSTQVEGLARALAADGHDVIVVTAHVDPATPAEETIDGFRVYRIPALHLPKMEISLSFPWLNWVFWPRNLKRIEKLLRSQGTQIVHVHNHMFDMAFVARVVSRRMKLPMVLTMHTVIKHANPVYNAILKFFDRNLLGPFIIKRADLVISPDNNMGAYLESRFGRRDAALVTYGVDPPRAVSAEELEQIRQTYGLGNSPVIVSVGHVHAIRNRHELLRALPMVIKRVPDVKLVIVGGVFSQTPADLAAELGITDHVVFVGAQERARISAFLKLASVEAHWLNQDEGTWASPGLASMEAMYAALPVLTVSNEAIYGPGVLKDRENIVLVERERVDALADRLIELLTQPDMAAAIGARAAATCDAHFSWPTTARRTVAVYRSALSSAARS